MLASQADLPCGHQPLGRLIEVHVGKDGHNRVAQYNSLKDSDAIHKLIR